MTDRAPALRIREPPIHHTGKGELPQNLIVGAVLRLILNELKQLLFGSHLNQGMVLLKVILTDDRRQWRFAFFHPVHPGPRTTRPAAAPVGSPSLSTCTPLTKTCRTPVAY